MFEAKGKDIFLGYDIHGIFNKKPSLQSKYPLNLLRAVVNDNKIFNVVLYSGKRRRQFTALGQSLEHSEMHFQNYYSPARLIWDRRLSVFHSFGGFLPRGRNLIKILSLTDFTPLVNELVFENKDMNSKWVDSLRKFDCIVCPSELAANMLLDYMPEKAGRIKVILPGVDVDGHSAISSTKAAEVLRKFGITDEYFLYAGKIAPGRNIHNLIKAYLKYWQRSQTVPSLVMLSEIKDEFSEKLLKDTELLRSKGKFRITGKVAEEELHYLYHGARALIYPVSTDVYSPQIMEAMAMGVPVVCSQEGFGAEIDDGAARFMIPYEPDDICTAIEAVESNQDYRAQLIQKGRTYAAKYNWQLAASAFIKLYSQMIGKEQ